MTSFSSLSNTSLRQLFCRANVAAAILFCLSWLLAYIGLPYLSPLIGLLVLFVPGFNISFAVWRLARTKETLVTLALWTVIFSLTLLPAGVFLISKLPLGNSNPSYLVAFNLVWLITFVASGVLLFVRQESTERALSVRLPFTQEFYLLSAAFLVIIGTNLLLYPYIPERDAYTYIAAAKHAALDPSSAAMFARSIFVVLLDVMSQVLRLDVYWVMKVVFPILSFVTVATIYLRAKNMLHSRALRLVASLSLFTFPVVLQEILIPRPQTLFVLCLVPALYLLERIRNDGEHFRAIYWLAALMLACAAGLGVHFLFMFVLLLTLGALASFVWPWMKKEPIDSIMILAVIATLLLLSRLPFADILDDLRQLAQVFGSALMRGDFRWWFLDNYTNADGNEVGWPGIGQLYYYIYNLGVWLVPVLIGLAVYRTNIWKQVSRFRYWATGVLLLIFFFIAEIAPRFGVAYLPDRAWHFMVLLAAVLAPALLQPVEKLKNARVITLLVVIAFAASVIMGSALTYAKKGEVNKNEIAAAEFIKQSTNKNAVFFGQGAGTVFVGYFGERLFYKPGADVFMSDDPDAFEDYLAGEKETFDAATKEYYRYLNELSAELSSARQLLVRTSTNDADKAKLAANMHAVISKIDAHVAAGMPKAKTFVTESRPMYIIYSHNRFDSIYSQRSWWMTSNLYGANVDKFTQKYPLIYSEKGVMIWEVRK